MDKLLDLNIQNMITVMLVQALRGAISPNFRRVALSLVEPIWQLTFVLEKEDPVDREEIDDVAGEFDGLLLGLNNIRNIKFEVKIEINDKPLEPLDLSRWRIVFRRRETAL